MKKTVSLFTILTLFVAAAVAQNPVFRILATKGDNKVQQGSAWTSMSTGSKVYKGNKVQITEGGYAGLMHKSGKTIELKTPGTFDITELEAKLSTKSTTFAEKYAKFALNDLNGDDEYKTNYNVTGTVVRGDSDAEFIANSEMTLIKNVPITLSWIEGKQGVVFSDDMEIRLINLFDEVVYRAPVTEKNYISLNIPDNIKTEGKLLLTLYDNKISKDLTVDSRIKVAVEGKDSPVAAEYEKLTKELSIDSPMDNLVLASFFEENKMSNYALSSLNKAHILAPDVSDFEDTFVNYMITSEIVDAEIVKKVIKK